MLLLLALACGPTGPDAFEAGPTEKVQTVIEVRWRADEDDSAARVAWGLDEGASESVDATREGAFFRALIPGQPQLTTVWVKPIVVRDGVEVEGELRSVETGILPAGVPQIFAEPGDPGAVNDPLVMTAVLARENWIFILDRDANVRWYFPIPQGFLALHVEMALDGQSLLFNLNHNDRTQDRGAIWSVAADGTVLERIPTPRAHHAFTQLGGGSLAYTAITVDDGGENQRVVGDVVLERSPDGELRNVFDCFEHLEIFFQEQAPFYPQGYDWTHANALRYSPESGTYLLSLANLNTVIEFDPNTREPTLMMGDEGSMAFSPPEGKFEFQHDAQWIGEDRLLLFDSPQSGSGHARALELAIDRSAQTATVVWESNGGREINVSALGSVERLENGNTLTSWGAAGELIEVDADGAVVWKAVSSLGSGFSTARVFPGEEAIF